MFPYWHHRYCEISLFSATTIALYLWIHFLLILESYYVMSVLSECNFVLFSCSGNNDYLTPSVIPSMRYCVTDVTVMDCLQYLTMYWLELPNMVFNWYSFSFAHIQGIDTLYIWLLFFQVWRVFLYASLTWLYAQFHCYPLMCIKQIKQFNKYKEQINNGKHKLCVLWVFILQF